MRRRVKDSVREFMNRSSFRIAILTMAVAALAPASLAAQSQQNLPPLAQRLAQAPIGGVVRPNSGFAQPGTVRTHYQILLAPPGAQPPSRLRLRPNNVAPFTGYSFHTPASLACVYQLVTPASGCNTDLVTAVSTRGVKAIAIVDAYHYADALTDANFYSDWFGLPALTNLNFTQTFVGATQPISASGTGWDIEGAVDIAMAHAMAPNAKIFYVEAQSSAMNDMMAAVDLASSLVAGAGGGQVTMSWGASESTSQTVYESHFTPGVANANVTYFASTGDAGDQGPLLGTSSANYPATSPQVVAVGGTSLAYDANGSFSAEKAWSGGGAGLSEVFSRPSFQANVASVVGAARGVPDISAVANPNTGVWVYNFGGLGGWNVIGGTSVSSPLVAGIVNAIDGSRPSTANFLTILYSLNGNTNYLRDVTIGACGSYEFLNAGTGYDLCTGLGAPK